MDTSMTSSLLRRECFDCTFVRPTRLGRIVLPSLYLNKVPPSPAWLSSALSVVKSAGLDQDAGTPVLDVNPIAPSTEYQQIRAVAGNDTASTTFNDVRVQLWAYAAATATASGLYLSSMGGSQGVLIPAGGALQIDIGPGQGQPFTRDWDKTYDLTAGDPDIISHFVNNEVHCCILGNVYQSADGTSAPIPSSPNPGALLNVATNRHHAQRNMTIKKHPTNFRMDFPMFAANPDPDRDQVFTLQLAEHQPRKFHGWELAELDALGPWIRRTDETPRGGIPGIEVVIDGKPQPVRVARKALEDLEMDIEDEGAGPELRVGLGADEARRMFLHATIPDEEFVLRIIDVAQTQDERTVGGMRLMVMTVPEELLKPPKRNRS